MVTYNYTFYITGYKKHIDELIMFLGESAASLIRDKKWVHNPYNSQFPYLLVTIERAKSVIESVEYEPYDLTDILTDPSRIPQTMGLSQLPTFKVVLKTRLPIRDDRVLQAKGVVEAIRFYAAKHQLFRYPMNSKSKTYTIFCLDNFNEILDYDTSFYQFPTRPDYTLKNCFLSEEIYLKKRKHFHIENLMFIHKVDLTYESNISIPANFIKSFKIVDQIETDYIIDARSIIKSSIQQSNKIYAQYHDSLVSAKTYNTFVKSLFTANLRTGYPNTCNSDGVPGLGAFGCYTYGIDYTYMNIPLIRLSKKIVNFQKNNIMKYLYTLTQNLVYYSFEYFTS